MTLLIKLILAHLIGDFFLQSAKWIKEKEEKKFRSLALYLHVCIHGVLVMLLVWDIQFWRPVVILMISHAFIDGLKATFQTDKNRRALFFIDQFLHLAVIGVLWYFWQNLHISFASILTEQRLIYLTAMVAVTIPASIAIKVFVSQWLPETTDIDSASLTNAGKYIGIFERLFILAFLLTGHWEGIGFLIAAKSVFRFGDLKESKDRKLTEYILIGTLLSFGIAIATGLLVLQFAN
ncbi:MAG: DUF3307 domain-containing protein [Prolixibacteraceae bacterium]|nr:DUF3307 domain-containing protein [Prolixibacteraceae bacterium]